MLAPIRPRPIIPSCIGTPSETIIRADSFTASASREARLRRVLEAFPEALLLVRADGSIFFANAAANESFGYKPAQLLDMPVEHLVPALNRELRVVARSESEAVRDLSKVVSRYADGTEMRMDVRAIQSGAGEGELVRLFRLARAPLS